MKEPDLRPAYNPATAGPITGIHQSIADSMKPPATALPEL